MKLVWSAEADADRIDIFEYILADNPSAAFEMDQLFKDKAWLLPDFPHLGRPGVLSGTRELTVHPNYRLVYEVVADEVRVLNVVHAARDWP